MSDKRLDIRITASSSSVGRAATEAAQGLNRLKAAASGLPAGFARLAATSAVGFFSAEALLSRAAKTLAWADSLKSLAQQLDLSTESLQAFGYAARRSNVSEGDVFMALRQLRLSIARAQSGSKSDVAGLAAFGFSAPEAAQLGAEQVFRSIAEKMRDARIGTAEVSAAFDLLGRAAQPVLGAMRAGFADAAQEAARVGAVLRDDVVQQLAAANDLIGKRKEQGGRLWDLGVLAAIKAFDWQFQFTPAGRGLELWRKLSGKSPDEMFGEFLGKATELLMGKPVRPASAPPPLPEPPAAPHAAAAEAAARRARGPLIPQADELARIGLFRGPLALFDPAQRTRQALLAELQRARAELGTMNRSLV